MHSRLPASQYAYARFDISGSDLWYHHHWYGRGYHRGASGKRMKVSVLLFGLVV